MKIKKLLSLSLSALLALSLFTGCGGGGQEPEENVDSPDLPQESVADSDLEGTLVFALWDNLSLELFEDMDLEGRFQELYPNANIEFEKLQDDSEYWNAMKIRAAANQLPDIMYNKTFTLSQFKEYLYDLKDTEAVRNNMLAEGYALNNEVLGVPEKQGHDYVYYWADMFEEAGVGIPTTWPEFIEVSKKLQDHYGPQDSDFMAISIGAKDEWPTYPFMEFMPAAEGGNGQNWNLMVEQDAPFAEGTDTNKAFNKVNSLFTSGVFGKDPLGLGHDQALGLFAQRKAAIFVSGSWALAPIKEGVDSLDNLKSFYLPTRDSENHPFRVVTQGDSFMSVTKHSNNPELAMAFLEFFFSDAWYPDFINAIPDDNTMTTVTKDKDEIFKFASEHQPDIDLVTYDGGGDDFQALVSETKFDYKKLGAEMFVQSFNLDEKLASLDKAWSEARESLGIK